MVLNTGHRIGQVCFMAKPRKKQAQNHQPERKKHIKNIQNCIDIKIVQIISYPCPKSTTEDSPEPTPHILLDRKDDINKTKNGS